MTTSRSVVLVACGVVLGLVIGGTTVAYAASSSKTVKVCVTKKNVVRAASSAGKCPKKTKKKSVSIQGPAGATGATGRTGSAGAIGPSDAWALTVTGRPSGATLPAGSYVVSGTVGVNGGTNPNCTMWREETDGGISVGRATFGYGSGSVPITIPVSSVFDLPKGGTAWITCNNVSGYLLSPNVAITKVGALH